MEVLKQKMKMLLELKNAKILVVAGILVFATGTFLENWSVTRLSSVKAGLTELIQERGLKFKVEKPTYPIKESKFLIRPSRVASDATEDEIKDYDRSKLEYDNKKIELNDKYKSDIAKYKEYMKEYRTESNKMNKLKALSNADYIKEKKELRIAIKELRISVNSSMFASNIFRYLAMLLFMYGTLGILRNGESYEKLGILIFLGLAFKTLTGL